jgi:hypothetical protein
LIESIINILKNETHINAIHLFDWADYIDKGSLRRIQYKAEKVSNDLLFEIGGYKLTLISSMIFSNNKLNDKEIFEIFTGNSFLGFQLFLNSIESSKDAIILRGTSLLSVNTSVSFNAFNSFTIDMAQCIEYALQTGVLNKKTAEVLMNSIIFNLTKVQYAQYKINGELYGKKLGSIDEIDKLLYTYLGEYSGYTKWLKPLKSKSRKYLYCKFMFERILRKLRLLYPRFSPA